MEVPISLIAVERLQPRYLAHVEGCEQCAMCSDLEATFGVMVPTCRAPAVLASFLEAFQEVSARLFYIAPGPPPAGVTAPLRLSMLALRFIAKRDEIEVDLSNRHLSFATLIAFANSRNHALPADDIRSVFLSNILNGLFLLLRRGKTLPPSQVHPAFEFATKMDAPHLAGLIVDVHRHYGGEFNLALSHTVVHCQRYSARWGKPPLHVAWHPYHYVLVALLRAGADPYKSACALSAPPIVTLCSPGFDYRSLLIVKIFWPQRSFWERASVTLFKPYSAPLCVAIKERHGVHAPVTAYIRKIETLSRWQAILQGVPPDLTQLALHDGNINPLFHWRATLEAATTFSKKDATAAASGEVYRRALAPIDKAPEMWGFAELDTWFAFLCSQERLRREGKIHATAVACTTIANFFQRHVK